MEAAPSSLTPAERRIVGLLALVQFVNVLDFMMVMPMGPDFSAALGIPTSKLGLIGGSYTAAAAVSGLVAALVLDRFSRKKALMSVVSGLALATFAGALATGLYSLLATRLIAGAFGGPATALALAIVADSVPVERRGRALGVVMGAFSVASIAGVPAGLELARHGGWRAPFLAVGSLTLLTVVGALFAMREPPSTRRPTAVSLAALTAQLTESNKVLSLVLAACVNFSSFVVVPNIAAYVQLNLGFPRERIGLMYLAGGTTSLVAMQLAGRTTDRFGARSTNVVGSAITVVALAFGFAHHLSWFHPVLIAVLLMGGTSVRAISFNALTSRVPLPSERGAFMSVQSSVQHFAAACGAITSAQLLTSDASGRLSGMDVAASLGVAASLVVPLLVYALEQRLGARQLAPSAA